MSTPLPLPHYGPSQADIQAYMTAHSVTFVQARMALIHAQTAAAAGKPVAGAPPTHTLTAAAFIARITPDVWGKIRAARQGSTPLALALDQAIAQLEAEPTVEANNVQLLAMLSQLVTAGVITAEDQAFILNF